MRKEHLALGFFLCTAVFFFLSVCDKRFLTPKFSKKAVEDSLTAYEKLFAGAPHLAYDKEGRGGYINKEGEWVIEAQYLAVKPFKEGYAAVQDADTELWGYIDVHGKTVIKPQFMEAGSFINGSTAVKEPEGGFGIIDRRGKFIVEPIYRAISYFKEGFARAEDMETGEYWLLNEEGEKVFGPYKGAYLFHNGKALVNETEKNRDWFFIDKKGKKYPFNEEVQIVMAKWYGDDFWTENAYLDFSEGYPEIINDNYVAVNEKGEAISPEYKFLDSFDKNGYALATIQEGEDEFYGIVDKQYNWVIEPEYSYLYNFQYGYAIAKKKEWKEGGRADYIVMDLKGNVVFTDWKEDEIMLYPASLSKGNPLPAYTEKNDVWKMGYIDWDHSILIPFKYDDAYAFAEDGSYAVVEKNGLYGVIDKKGNWILKPKFGGFSLYGIHDMD